MASPGSMHEAGCSGCTGMTLRDGMGREAGRRVRIRNTCTPMADSCECMAKTAAAAATSLQSCPTLCDPIDGSPPGSPCLGFSRQEHWSGLPLPSPMRESESEVAQPCLTFRDPMDCSPPGSSIHGIFQAGEPPQYCKVISLQLKLKK